MLQKCQIRSTRPSAVQRKACNFQRKGLKISPRGILCIGKGRSNQRAIVFKHTAKLDKGFLGVRHNVQCIGDNDNIKGLVSIRQMEHILHGKIQLGGKIAPLCLRNHRCGDVGSLNVVGRTQEMLCHLPCAGGYLQNGFVPHSRAKQRI